MVVLTGWFLDFRVCYFVSLLSVLTIGVVLFACFCVFVWADWVFELGWPNAAFVRVVLFTFDCAFARCGGCFSGGLTCRVFDDLLFIYWFKVLF